MSTDAPNTRRVLVAVDGSPASLEALRVGHRMATLFGEQLVGVTAWQSFRHGVLPPTSTHPEETAERLVTTSVIEAFRGGVVPPIEIVAVEGDPAENLIALSRDATLLVVGSRGHSGLAGVLLGSVSNACAAHASCPVLVVHAPAAAAAVPAAGLTADLTADQRIVVTL
ncbi:universal stress protein [Nakamurella sp. PAMC28650]|jgi:nucleotide-binding universal stress UspA family protein|uniref:universal stress protein n=1 Tax=Nakamurella sp. PAMC28650 TaxID=2762325 RepID=UPI00164DF6EF|nr:universal stress protein [Nakamurella sp. PAMC28650]QNK80238.1 universal stress protein [Nakamurella sp. PAMC28650]